MSDIIDKFPKKVLLKRIVFIIISRLEYSLHVMLMKLKPFNISLKNKRKTSKKLKHLHAKQVAAVEQNVSENGVEAKDHLILVSIKRGSKYLITCFLPILSIYIWRNCERLRCDVMWKGKIIQFPLKSSWHAPHVTEYQ